MQRRVRRPFARVKAMVEKTPDLHAKQSASYVSVETCRDNKAAVLSLLIRLPGDRQRGVPTVNRTGIGFGSTLVRMNQSSTKSRDRRTRLSRNRHSTSILIDEHSTWLLMEDISTLWPCCLIISFVLCLFYSFVSFLLSCSNV